MSYQKNKVKKKKENDLEFHFSIPRYSSIFLSFQERNRKTWKCRLTAEDWSYE